MDLTMDTTTTTTTTTTTADASLSAYLDHCEAAAGSGAIPMPPGQFRLTEATRSAGLPDYAVYRYQLDRRPLSIVPARFEDAAALTLRHIAGELADMGSEFHAVAAQALTEIAAEFDTLARYDRGMVQARTYCQTNADEYRAQAAASLEEWRTMDDGTERDLLELRNVAAHARMSAYADAVRVMDIATD
jgi:hypothetical protein